jgi:hypothetical protein
MTTRIQSSLRPRVVVALAALLWGAPAAFAQAPPPATADPAAAPAAAAEKSVSQQELDQLLAPVALYPDALLAQVLMASTYPLEIVSADRWAKANPGLKDKALEDALQSQAWDPAVKSLTAFPQVLTMMSEKLDWTQKLGDAFLAQQQEVMNTVQALRQKAVAQGNLKDTPEQKVTTEKVESTTVVKIEPSNPEVVYVPTYNPTVVYGAWPYPAYPPYYYYPPGYVAGGALLGFTAGVIVGGALWGGCNWGRGEVNVNVNRYNNFNKTNISNGNWQHNVNHRGAVPYKDRATAQKFDRAGAPGASQREAYRGRSDATRAGGLDSARAGGLDSGRTGGLDSGRAGGLDSGRAGGLDSGRAGGMDAGRAGGSYGSNSGRSSAFNSGGAAQTRSVSNRGASSMSSSRGGGGARGGGGGRGGGRR